jgi:hypothetical protein
MSCAALLELAPWTNALAQNPKAAPVLLTAADVDRVTGLKGTYSEPGRVTCCVDFDLYTADSTDFMTVKFIDASTYEGLKALQSDATPVTGVGDAAYYDATLQVLTFRKGARAVSLQVVPNPTNLAPITREQVTTLARTMASRL